MGKLKKGCLCCNLTFGTPSGYPPDSPSSSKWVPVSSDSPNKNAADGSYMWRDGETYYRSPKQGENYVWNGTAWVTKTFKGLNNIIYTDIWTDGTHTYYSSYDKQYVLNGDTWEVKKWNGLSKFDGLEVWSDGTHIYRASSGGEHYVLNGDTWETKNWGGYVNFRGRKVWSDGTSIYCSKGNNQYVLNGDTWEVKNWNGLSEFYGYCVWSDGTNIYYSHGDQDEQYVLNGDTWEVKKWELDATSFYGSSTWSDEGRVYYNGGIFSNYRSYMLEPANTPAIDHTAMVQGWVVGKRLAAMRKREPVAYLYNGVRLPKLPEWDKTVYPYAYMTKSKSLGLLMYAVDATSVPAKYTPYENNPIYDGALLPVSDGAKCIFIAYTESGGDWKVSEEKDYTGTVVSDTSVPIWTNNDIYNEGGALYLAASEPVPVYE